MAHIFDVYCKHRLDNPLRRELLPPYQVLEQLGLKEGDVLADIGCGIGYFTIPAADIVGTKGIVYAMDIEYGMIEEVERRSIEYNNIRTVVTDEYDLKIDDGGASFGFICTVLHEVNDKYKFINGVKRKLNSGGEIAIVEWIKKESDWGPSMKRKIDMLDVAQLMSDNNFNNISCIKLNDYFYAVKAVNT